MCRGHNYATVVSDSERGIVPDVEPGCDKYSVKALLQGLLGDVKDEMWRAYISSSRELFPNATLIQYLWQNDAQTGGKAA